MPPHRFHDREDGFWATHAARKDGGTNPTRIAFLFYDLCVSREGVILLILACSLPIPIPTASMCQGGRFLGDARGTQRRRHHVPCGITRGARDPTQHDDRLPAVGYGGGRYRGGHVGVGA